MDHLLDASRLNVDVECIANFQVTSLWTSRLVHMQGVPIGAVEHGGNTYLSAEQLAHTGPTGIDTLITQGTTYDLHELISGSSPDSGESASCFCNGSLTPCADLLLHKIRSG